MSVLHVEYRLCPEHPFPAAVDDTIALYRALLRHNISSSQILIMGDSAGGGLALLIIQALVTHQLPVPRGVIILSPWADLSMSSESYTRNKNVDVMLFIEGMKWAAAQVLGPNRSEVSLYDPLISPIFGSFEGFPPMYINVGTTELIEDEARQVFKKAQEAGVDVTFEAGLHMMHVYPLFFAYYPEARNTLNNINKWIQTIFNQK
jgi:acetyl esterase/lipase